MGKNSTLSLKKRMRVLLIEADDDRAVAFGHELDADQFTIERINHTGIALLKQVDEIQPDLIIIDIESPDRDMLDSLHRISQTAPKPIVMFSEQDDVTTIEQLIAAGVSAYVVGESNHVRVKTVIDTALARFSHQQSIKQELKLTKQKLQDHKVVDKAKIWLMQSKQYSEHEAYHCLRKMAMDNSQKIEDVAKNLLSLASMLEL